MALMWRCERGFQALARFVGQSLDFVGRHDIDIVNKEVIRGFIDMDPQ
jgi:hypothetical protein